MEEFAPTIHTPAIARKYAGMARDVIDGKSASAEYDFSVFQATVVLRDDVVHGADLGRRVLDEIR